jgi:hypothetical protein
MINGSIFSTDNRLYAHCPALLKGHISFHRIAAEALKYDIFYNDILLARVVT